MRTVSRGRLTFDVVEHGPADGDPVLLLHGFPQRASSWDGVAARLAERGYRTVAPDQRGYSPGARPTRRRDYVADQLVADALAVIDEVAGPTGRVHVVGHDWGAVVAWLLGARHPDRVRSLTAVSVPPPDAFLRSLLGRQAIKSWYMLFFQLPWLPERLLGAGDRPFSPRVVELLARSGQSREAARRDAVALAEPGALAGGINWYRAIPLRAPKRETTVSVPSLFVWSDRDTAVGRTAVQRVDRYVAGPYRFVELAGVSHWIPDEEPETLAGLIAEHATAHPG